MIEPVDLGPLFHEVDATISRLGSRSFKCDPLVDPKFSQITSIVSSAYKRHGLILEHTMLAALKHAGHLQVWSEPAFAISTEALLLADRHIHGNGNNLDYGDAVSTRQIDVMVYNQTTEMLGAYDSKRGFGYHDAGKKRSMVRDLKCTKMLLRSYGITKGLKIGSVTARAVSHLGRGSLPLPWALPATELDQHFGTQVTEPIVAVTAYFGQQLNSLLEAVSR